MAKDHKLELKDIDKTFPGVKALDNVNLSIEEGSVHVLCGENGAGKSTLVKIINGVYQPDNGKIFYDEKKISINSPVKAKKLGISMIFQELDYVPEMTVSENFFAGDWPTTKLGKIDWEKVKNQAKDLLENEGLIYNLDTKLGDLAQSDIQMLEITKAVSRNAELIIMDEPTSALSNKEIDALFKKIESLKERGKTIIYISHKLDEVFEVADKISVLRNGKLIDTRKTKKYDKERVIKQMIGKELGSQYPKEDIGIGEKIFEVSNLSRKDFFQDINIDLYEGEIVGLAGLVGAGRSEVLRSIFGLDPIDLGKVKIRGKEINVESPQDSIKNGIVMMTEDRHEDGIIPVRSVRENISITELEQFFYGGRLHPKKERQAVDEVRKELSIKTPTLDTQVNSLSGGNQQKTVLGKWLVKSNRPEVFLLDEPTRGVDIGAKRAIFELVTNLARQDKGILMVSSELQELIGMCDRIYVMSEGEITGHLEKESFSEELIMSMAVGLENGQQGGN